MKKLHILGLAALSALVACSDKDYLSPEQLDADRDNRYTQNWIKKFDVPSPTQDWCMLTPVEAKVRVAGADKATSVNIYSKSPELGGKLLAVSRAEGSVWFDVIEGSSSVYAQVVDEKGDVVSAGTYSVTDSKVDIDGSATDTDMPQSRYAHDTTYGSSWFNAMVVCEDLGSSSDSDFDFNDIVLGFHLIGGTNTLQVVPMAAGGTIPADLKITIGDEAHSAGEIHELLKPGAKTSEMINTYKPFKKAGATLTYTVPSDWTIAKAWQNKQIALTIDNHGVAYDIKTPDIGTAPKMICLGGDWFWPVERKPIDVAYPGFAQWAKDGHNDAGLTAWVDNYADLKMVVDWDLDKVADNWFSATTPEGNYNAKINNSKTVNVLSGVRYFMDAPTSAANMFNGRKDIETVDITGDHFNTAAVASVYAMFQDTENLKKVDLSGWNTDNLTNVYDMFYRSGVKEVTMDGWNLSNIHRNFGNSGGNDAGSPFVGTSLETLNLNNAKLGEAFYTYSGYGYSTSHGILSGVRSTLATVNAENVTFTGGSTYRMFANCVALKNLNLTGWKLPSATSLGSMFTGCSALESINLDGWDVSNVSSLASLFSGCSSLKSVSMAGWTTSSLTSTNSMFADCTSLTDLDLSGWNTSNLTDVYYMLQRSGIKNLTLDGWDLSNISGGYGNSGGSNEYGPLAGTSLEVLNINNAKLNNVFYTDDGYGYSHKYGFLGGTQSTLREVHAQNCTFTGTSTYRMFAGCSELTTLDLSGWSLPETTSLSSMFTGCSAIENLNLDNWDISKVTTTASLFDGCSSLKNVSLKKWNTESLTDASSMFAGCENITKLDLSSWNTSNLASITSMFAGTGLKEINLDGWDLTKLTFTNYGYNTMDQRSPFKNTPLETLKISNARLNFMFRTHVYYGNNTSHGILTGCASTLKTIIARNCVYIDETATALFHDMSNLEVLDVTGWDTRAMKYMGGQEGVWTGIFEGCSSLQSLDLSTWDVSNVVCTDFAFSDCTSLRELNLTGWDLSNVTSMKSMFAKCTGLRITCCSDLAAIFQSKLSQGELDNIVFNIVPHP